MMKKLITNYNNNHRQHFLDNPDYGYVMSDGHIIVKIRVFKQKLQNLFKIVKNKISDGIWLWENKRGIFFIFNRGALWGIRFCSSNCPLKTFLNFIHYPSRGF